uniref:Uncharacterized protein n=1 Tax=Mesocestoides corti TaxID=53468 RepID=A0A5K3G3J8_MESCO
MDFVTLEGDPPMRLSAFGTLDGWIGIGLVDMAVSELKCFISTHHDSVITRLKFFREDNADGGKAHVICPCITLTHFRCWVIVRQCA